MTVEKILYENKDYNISNIEKDMDYHIPSLLNTLYVNNMVVMPKCKTYINLSTLELPSVQNALDTSGYIAVIRTHYRNSHLKRGCVARILNFLPKDEKDLEYDRIYVDGIRRFISYQDSKIMGYPYEVIKPDFKLFENDTINTPIPIDFNDLDPIFLQFFLTFTTSLDIEAQIDFNSLSLDKFLNSLIMIMPISDMERFYLSEIPSLTKRKEALSLILSTTFSNLTSDYKVH